MRLRTLARQLALALLLGRVPAALADQQPPAPAGTTATSSDTPSSAASAAANSGTANSGTATQASPAPAPAAAPAVSTADDRLILSGSAYTLSDASGGGDGALGYIHNFNSDAAIGVGGEYETLANAHWSFGSLSASYGGGTPGARWDVYAEGHEGDGDIGTHPFDYSVIAVGASGTLASKFSVQAESRQFDVDNTHGNLPKVSLTWLPTPKLQIGVNYAYSVGGNLNTQIAGTRVDVYNPGVNVFAGGAIGHAAPAVIDFQTGAVGASPSYKEGFVGLAKPLRRVEWSLLGDYLDLASHYASTRRWTLTVICTLHLRAPPR